MASFSIKSPRATQGIVAATLFAYLLLWFFGPRAQYAYAFLVGLVPARLSGTLVVDGAIPALLTPLTATFLHGSLVHLLFNMAMLFYIGRFVELVIGAPRFLILYAAGAYAAAFAEFIIRPESTIPIIGASGAVSALIGAYALYFGKRKTQAGRILSAETLNILWLAISWIGLQLLMGVVMNDGSGSGIAIWAHIGGFIAGLLLARPLLPKHLVR